MKVNCQIFVIFLFVMLYFVDIIQTAGVPRITGSFPFPGLTRSTVTILMPTSLQPHPIPLTTTYTFPTVYALPPKILISIIQLTWYGPLIFDLQIGAITTTNCIILLNNYPTTNLVNSYITVLNCLIGIFNPYVYSHSYQYFQYIQNSTVPIAQNITVTNHQDHGYPILVAYQDNFDPVVHNTITNPTTPQLSQSLVIPLLYTKTYTNIINNGLQGYLIKRIKYQLNTLTVINFTKYDSNYVVLNVGSNGGYASITGLEVTDSLYGGNVFYGLHMFKMVNSLGITANIKIGPLVTTNTNSGMYMFYAGFVYNKCPVSAPYIFVLDSLCYVSCPVNISLINPQIPSYNSYYVCIPCSQQCLTCSNINTNCTSCSPGFVLSIVTNTTKTCKCQPYQYGTPPTCTNCNISINYCSKCANASYCLRCDDSLIFNATTNACECLQTTTMITIAFNYTIAGQNYTVPKIICISQNLTESCNSTTGMAAFGLSCNCQSGQPFFYGGCIS